MMSDPAPPSELVERAIRAGCAAGDLHLVCSYPKCTCTVVPQAVRAAIAALPAAGAAMALREALERLINADAAGVPNNEWDGAKKQARAALASAPARPSPPSPQEPT